MAFAYVNVSPLPFFHIEHNNPDDKSFFKTVNDRGLTPTGLEMTYGFHKHTWWFTPAVAAKDIKEYCLLYIIVWIDQISLSREATFLAILITKTR